MTHTRRLLNNSSEISFFEFTELGSQNSPIPLDPASPIVLRIIFEDPDYSIELVSGRYLFTTAGGDEFRDIARIEVLENPSGSYTVRFFGEFNDLLDTWFLEIDRLCSFNVTSVDSPCYIARDEITADGVKPTIRLDSEIVCDNVTSVSTGGETALSPLGDINFMGDLVNYKVDAFLTLTDDGLNVEISINDGQRREATQIGDVQYQLIFPEPQEDDTQEDIDNRRVFTVAVSDALEWQRVHDEQADGELIPREIEVRNPHAFCITQCTEVTPLLKAQTLGAGVTLLDTLEPRIFQLSPFAASTANVTHCQSLPESPYRARSSLANAMIIVEVDGDREYELQRTCEVYPLIGFNDPTITNAQGLVLLEAQIIDGSYAVQRQVRDNRLYTTPTTYIPPALEQRSV